MPDYMWKKCDDGVEGETLNLGIFDNHRHEGYVCKLLGADKWLWCVYRVISAADRDHVGDGRAFTRRDAKKAVRAWMSEERRRAQKRSNQIVTLYFVGMSPQDALDRRRAWLDSEDARATIHLDDPRAQTHDGWKVYATEIPITPDMLTEDG